MMPVIVKIGIILAVLLLSMWLTSEDWQSGLIESPKMDEAQLYRGRKVFKLDKESDFKSYECEFKDLSINDIFHLIDYSAGTGKMILMGPYRAIKEPYVGEGGQLTVMCDTPVINPVIEAEEGENEGQNICGERRGLDLRSN